MNPQSANFLSSDVEIKGTLSFGQALTFEGKIEGEIKTQGRVVIGQKAIVQGDVYAGAVVIAGRVTGNVVVTERCELQPEAQLIGDLKSPKLLIGEGATFIGQSEVVPPGGRPPASAPTPQQSAPAQGGAPNNPQNPPPQSPAPRRLFG
jgi:cytoskeletal protein CcmA (bactofilin family)